MGEFMTGVRDLKLKPRIENTREKKASRVVVFDLDEIKRHFDENMGYIEQYYEVARVLIGDSKIEDGENIWRSQIVFLDSALDFYLHELTKYGLWKIFKGDWSKTQKYKNLKVKMPFLENAIENVDDKSWFNDYVDKEFSMVPMMSYDAVKYQMNLLGINVLEVANEAFYCRGAEEKTVDKLKRRINELYYRRNLIAHQSDRKSHNAEREKITLAEVDAFVEDIKKIVDAIHSVATDK